MFMYPINHLSWALSANVIKLIWKLDPSLNTISFRNETCFLKFSNPIEPDMSNANVTSPPTRHSEIKILRVKIYYKITQFHFTKTTITNISILHIHIIYMNLYSGRSNNVVLDSVTINYLKILTYCY